MTEYVHHASQVLRAAGIAPDDRSSVELLHALADRARDWAERAAALGGDMDAYTATRVAAQALSSDAEVQRRLEALESGAADLLARIHRVASGHGAEPASAPRPARRRRWGREGQPEGTPLAAHGDEGAAFDLRLPASSLLGLPVIMDGEVVGVVGGFTFEGNGSEVAALMLKP